MGLDFDTAISGVQAGLVFGIFYRLGGLSRLVEDFGRRLALVERRTDATREGQ